MTLITCKHTLRVCSGWTDEEARGIRGDEEEVITLNDKRKMLHTQTDALTAQARSEVDLNELLLAS